MSQTILKKEPQQFLLTKFLLSQKPRKFPNIWATFVRKFLVNNFQNIAQSGHTGTDTTSARSILWMKSYNISPFKAVFELFQSLISVAYLMNGPLGATTMKNILLLKTAVLTLWIQSAIYNDKMAVLNGKILSLVTAHGVKSNATATVQTTKLIIFFDC